MLQARYTTSPWPVSNVCITYELRSVRNFHCASRRIGEIFIIKDVIIALTYVFVII